MGMNLKCIRKFLTPQGTKILAYEIFWIYSKYKMHGRTERQTQTHSHTTVNSWVKTHPWSSKHLKFLQRVALPANKFPVRYQHIFRDVNGMYSAGNNVRQSAVCRTKLVFSRTNMICSVKLAGRLSCRA